MEYLEGYRGRMGTKESNIRDRKVAAARSRAIKHFEEDPSFFTVNALEPDSLEIIEKRIRVINESVLKQLNPERTYSKYIIPHPDEPIISGTMLFGLYEVDWIVTAITGLGDVHQQATLQKLNEFITIKINNISETIPAVVNGVSRLSDGVIEMNLYTMPEELIRVKVQDNSLTRGIERNSRMKIANKMYELTKVDSYTDDGVLNWILKEDLKEYEDDNPAPTPIEGGISGEGSITRARDYVYTSSEPVSTWSILGTTPDVVKVTKIDDYSARVRAEKTQLITFTLVANLVSEEVFEKDIRLVSLL